MKITYKSSKKINPRQILDLYKSINWIKNSERLKTGRSIASAYQNSQIVLSAWDGKKLIGVIRALTDKKVNGVIFGLSIHKDYQKQGIGKKLLDNCMAKYPKIRWYVWAGNSKAEGFYRKSKLKPTKQILFERK